MEMNQWKWNAMYTHVINGFQVICPHAHTLVHLQLNQLHPQTNTKNEIKYTTRMPNETTDYAGDSDYKFISFFWQNIS